MLRHWMLEKLWQSLNDLEPLAVGRVDIPARDNHSKADDHYVCEYCACRYNICVRDMILISLKMENT